uniref:Peptide encoded by miPEP171b n=1 Tax=Medicago truncatula TaxID=3880 RepID=P171B_MEDTR|nr:RecName: Full=Peptide encoded by miPEP171b [Medicago truncatula]
MLLHRLSKFCKIERDIVYIS